MIARITAMLGAAVAYLCVGTLIAEAKGRIEKAAQEREAAEARASVDPPVLPY